MAILRSPVTAFDLDLPPTASEPIVNVMHAALAAVDPADALSRAVELRDSHLRVGTYSYDLGSRERIYVAGAGEASAPMAVALEELLGERITAGWVNVTDGYTAPTRIISIHEAGHPVPDARGVEGSQRIVGLLRQTGPKDLVFCLISGGGSALMTLPVEGITLNDIELLTQALLRSGATINEINAVRKHLSHSSRHLVTCS